MFVNKNFIIFYKRMDSNIVGNMVEDIELLWFIESIYLILVIMNLVWWFKKCWFLDL